MGKSLLADSIAYLPEFQSWYNSFTTEIAQFDCSNLLIYIIDTVEESLLPIFASQFHVTGYKGYKLAQTVTERRELIKRAIELHKYKGTEWAIIEALNSLGFTEIEIIKGTEYYDHWAKFGIKITNNTVKLSHDSIVDIHAMVNEYKRAVCVLEEIKMEIGIDDLLQIGEDTGTISTAITIADELKVSEILRYDGLHLYNGLFDYGGESDIVEIETL